MAAPYDQDICQDAYNMNLDAPNVFSHIIKQHATRPVKRSFLHELAQDGDTLAAEDLLSKEPAHDSAVNLQDEDGKTPLHNAAYYGHTHMVSLLLSCGAEVDIPIEPFGYTALCFAVARGHLDVTRLLLAHDADVHAVDALTGQSLLHTAATQNDLLMAGLLIEKGINVLAEDHKGRTARDYAVRARHESMERVLLKVMAHSSGW